ncbi:E3 ubiquitin-ligase RNF213-like [Brachionus plicatilis]|uniref:E3 ubiquitin-ligase RNF213-like n=1 Tax=Brachionus plicatilis TaxID=10195 RepID=A0A3M7S5Y4_BRAPC|nr:E3 ubiquitin-ligase RNF213-like [Brachionus plicatilis]
MKFKVYNSKKIIDLSECNLDDFSINLNQIDVKESLIKRIINFDEIDKTKIEKFKYFIEFCKENTYLLFYIQESINGFHKPVELKCFLDQILDDAFFKFNKLGEDLKNGKLDLKYFSNDIAKIGKNLKIEKENELYKTELVKAMDHVKMSEKEIEFRLKQLKHFLNLPKIKEISELLLEIKKKENLNSNFGPLEQIHQSLEETQNQFRSLDDITSSSMKLFESLDKLSDEKFVKCLRKYVEHFKFIEWLRSNASNLNELKLLCEFASQSENEGALEVVRVQSLLLVGTGFAPLIYDMKKDCSYDQMIRHIKQIFNNFSRNRELPEKIDAISKEKNWLKDIKESMGNTEANSLKQADRINKFGIFDFGLKANSKIDNLSLDDVFRVTVPRSKDSEQKSYSFNQLRDLQDKLALVVGKDETDQEIIEYFESNRL